MDTYRDFSQLSQVHRPGVDFEITARRQDSHYAIVAIHGGTIEHGTSRIAEAIAGDEHSFYSFEGLQDKSHHLHITSNRFDEPQALSLVRKVETVISIHGAFGQAHVVYFGGLDRGLGTDMMTALSRNGFPAEPDPSPTRQGRGVTNICNRGRSGRGLQLELPQGFRKSLFDRPDYRHRRWRPNRRFHEFIAVIRKVLDHQDR